MMEDSEDSKTKKVRMTDSGNSADFTRMLASLSALETLQHVGDLDFEVDEPTTEDQPPSLAERSTFNSDASLAPHFELILKLTHLIYEESKLDIIKQLSSLSLAKFLARIAHVLGMDKLKMQYLVDYPVLSSYTNGFSYEKRQKVACFNGFPGVLAENDRLCVLKFFPSFSNANCLSNYTAPCFVKWVADLIRARRKLLDNSHVKYPINTEVMTFSGGCCDSRDDKSSNSAVGSSGAGTVHGEEKDTRGKVDNVKLIDVDDDDDDVTFPCSSSSSNSGGTRSVSPFPCIWGVTERVIKTATVLSYIVARETDTVATSSLGSCSGGGSFPSKLNEGQENTAATTKRGDNCSNDGKITSSTVPSSRRNFSSTVAAAASAFTTGVPATGKRLENEDKDFTFTDLLFRSVNGLQNDNGEKDGGGGKDAKLPHNLPPFFRGGSKENVKVGGVVSPETVNWILNVEKILASKYQHGRIRSAVNNYSGACSQHDGKTAYTASRSDNNGSQNHLHMEKDDLDASAWSSQTAAAASHEAASGTNHFDFVGRALLLIVEIGMDCDLVDTLPFGVSLPILNVIYEGHLNPSFNWPVTVINLVRRRDLLKRKDVIFGDKFGSWHDKQEAAGKDRPCMLHKLGTQKQYILMEQRNSSSYISSSVPTADPVSTAANNFRSANGPSNPSSQSSLSATAAPETSGLEFDEEILNVLFADDCRVQSVKRMLNSSHPVKLKAQPQQTDLQSKLARYAKRTMALSVGRGMFTLSSVAPTLTSTEPIPLLNFAARVMPKNIIVNLTSATVSANSRQWAHYHNGVAAGLRIDQNSRDVDTAWVIYNR